MSDCVTLHIKGSISFDKLRSWLEFVTGHVFTMVVCEDWDIFRTSFLGFEISLFESIDFLDDCNIEFSSYSYIISLDSIPDSIECEYIIPYLELVGRVIARACCKELGCECVVVTNYQVLVASY